MKLRFASGDVGILCTRLGHRLVRHYTGKIPVPVYVSINGQVKCDRNQAP